MPETNAFATAIAATYARTRTDLREARAELRASIQSAADAFIHLRPQLTSLDRLRGEHQLDQLRAALETAALAEFNNGRGVLGRIARRAAMNRHH